MGERGFSTIDADAIVHELLARDPATIGEVREQFGESVLLPEGGADRAELAKQVFGDAQELAKLEAILHPRVRAIWEAAAETGGDWVIEIPLLFEKNLQKNVDLTICVFSDPLTQVERLERRGLSAAQVQSRMMQQMPVAEKAELADLVLLNDGSLEFLSEQVDLLISKIKPLHL